MFPFNLQTTLIAAGLSLALGLGGGGYVAWKIQQTRIDEQKIAALQGVNDAWKIGWLRRDAQEGGITFANRANANDQSRIAGNTQEIIRYVPKYITVQADARCVLPNGFVRLLDSALTGTAPGDLPGSTGELDSAPSGLTLSQATALLAQSLGDYAATRARILNGRAAWAAQAAIINAKPPVKTWWERNSPF